MNARVPSNSTLMETASPGMAVELLEGEAGGFAVFGFPRLASRLSPVNAPWIAVGLRIAGIPAGLALGVVQDKTALLLSLMVAAPLRDQGYGRGLAEAFAAEAQTRGAVIVDIGFSSRIGQRDALVRCLGAAGFSVPELAELITTGEAGAMLDAVNQWPSIMKRLRNPESASLEPWRELDGVDLAAVEALSREPGYVPGMAPQADPETFDPACSVAVRRSGQLLGWVVAESLPVITLDAYRGRKGVCYRSAYLTQRLWHTGLLVGAYRAAFEAQVNTYGPGSIAVFHTSIPRMAAMVRRRFGPIALQVDEHWRMNKTLACQNIETA
ncbi:Uncharacterised protein [Pannonibacter phragmitetus]|uniref:N-acetyltransferase domain-containing protein n=1 Tax=Pannonibacter phragmitetus TaxID=121719 RepID=A0A378ZWY8_9HYPH|nr:hypothetical protein [Pannonibacter phragmitetus]SUB01493.1 Uncharacterised protein [Pannonibacter phragmitetus]